MSDRLTSLRSPLLRPVAIGVVCVLAAGGALWLGFVPRHEATQPPVPAAQREQAVPLPKEAAAPTATPAPAMPPAAIAALPPATAPATVQPSTPAQPSTTASAASPGPAPAKPLLAAPALVAPGQPPATASVVPPAATPAPAEKSTEESAKPSFDIVRVSPQGEAVIAGRAAPGAEVTVAENGHEIGRTTADQQGQWVVIPEKPIGPGGKELTVASRAPDQQPVQGDAPVVVLMPEHPAATPAPVQPKPTPAPEEVASAPSSAPPAAPAPVATPAPTPAPAAAAPVVVLTPSNAAPQVLQAPPAAVASTPSPQLGLGTVDYDDRGEIRFAGTAVPGATVRTYIDNEPAGDAAAGSEGHWTLVPQAPVAVGDHRLRLDQLDGKGQVTARLELPFQRAELKPQEVAEGRIVVQPGNNLWRIARHAYGRGIQYVVIYQANRDQIRDPDLIYPGQVFAIPAPAAKDGGTAEIPASSSTSR